MSVSATSKGHGAAEQQAEVVHLTEGTSVVTLPAGSDLGGADFIRHGSDLEIVLPNGQHVVVPGFFDGSAPHSLATADGQMLPADLVARLAGPLAPGQFAQVGGAAEGAGLIQIGVVDKYSGTVTVRHADGTTSVVKAGDPIYQGDIIETAHGGAVGIVLADRSTFALGSEGRLVMDELVYDPATKDGHANLSVLKGSFSFISGQISHAAPDAMQVRTPVMTIGVRGTTVAGQVGENGQTSVALVGDVGGGSGQIVVSNAGGTQVLSQPNTLLTVSSSFSPPPPPVFVPPGEIAATFGGAISNLPVPPTNNSLEWNTTPGSNQPAPTQEIQSRPEAGGTIQVDSPGGSQVVPPAQQQQDPQQQGPAEQQQQQTPQQEGAAASEQQTAQAEGQAGAQGEQAATGEAAQGGAQGTNGPATGDSVAGGEAKAGTGASDGGGQGGEAGGTGTGTGTGNGTGPGTGTGTGNGADTGPGTGTGTGSGTGTGTGTGPGTGTGDPVSVGNGTGGPGGSGGGSGSGSGGFVWYSPTPPITGSGPKPVETISDVVQKSEASNSAVNETAANQGSGVSSSGTSTTSSGSTSTGSSGGTSGAGASSSDTAKTVVQETTSGGTDPVSQVIGGGSSSSGTGGTVGDTTSGTTTGGTSTTTPGSAINTGNDPVSGGGNTTTTPTTTSGRLVDGPVSGAQVFLDVNGDGVYQSGSEPVGVTDGNGYYTISGAGNYAIIALPGGTDTVTGQTINFTMKAPPGSTVVSPLTTLVAEVGEAKVKELLGITSTASLLTTDPTTSTEIYAAGIQVVATINALKNGLGLTQEQVMTALKDAMTNTTSTTGDFLTNTTTLGEIVSSSPNSNSNYANEADFLTAVSNASSAAHSAATSGGSIADIINPAPIEGAGNINLTSATDVTINIGALKAAGITSFTLSSGTGTLSVTQLTGVTITYTSNSTASVTLELNNDSAAGLSGFKQVSIVGSYGYMTAQQINALGVGNIQTNGNLLKAVVSGDVSGLNLQPANALFLEAPSTVTLAQLSQVTNPDNILNYGQGLSVIGVSGDVTLGGNYFGKLVSVMLSGNATLSYDALNALESGGGSLNVGSFQLTLGGLPADVTASNIDFSQVTNMVLSGDVTMTLAQYQDFAAQHGSVTTGGYGINLTDVSFMLTLTVAELAPVASVTLSGEATMSAAQIDAIGPDSITKNGNLLTVNVSGDIRGLDLTNAVPAYVYDAMHATGDVAMTLGQYEAVVHLFTDDALTRENGALVTVDAGTNPDLTTTDTSLADKLILNSVLINLHDGDSVETNWTALHAAHVNSFTLSAGTLDLSVAQMSGKSFATMDDAQVLVTDTSANIVPDLASLAAAGVTGLVFYGVASMSMAQYAQLQSLFGDHYIAASGLTISDTAANIQAGLSGLEGVTAIVITDSNPVYYGVADHAALTAITTPVSQVGWYLVDGNDISALGTVKLVKIEAGATVVMTADQINTIGQMTQVAPEAWMLTKGAGAELVAEISGNVSGMLLGYADKFLLTADAMVGKADFVAKEILKDGFALTVDGGSYAEIFTGVDLSVADYIKWGGNVIAIHDGDAVEIHWSDLAAAGVSTFHLTSGSVELSYADFGVTTFTTETGATVTVSDDASTLLPYVADLKDAGVTDLHFTGDATLSIADLSALSDNFDGHFTAAGVVTLVAAGDLSAVVVDFSLVDAINLSDNVTFSEAQYTALMNADVTVNTLGFEVTLNDVSGTLSLSAAELAAVDQLVLSWDITVSEDQFAALVANEVVIVKDGSGGPFSLMLEASGTLSLDALDLVGIDVVILTGDLTLTPEQYAALDAAGTTFDIGAGEHLYVTSISTPLDETIQAVDGGSVQFHGDMLDYRFSGGNGSIIVDDLRLKSTPGHDGTDIITDANMVMGAFTLDFADASVDVTSGDYIAQLRFGDANTTARIGSGLDMVMFEGGDDTVIVEQGIGDFSFNYNGTELNGGDGTDTIQAEGYVDLSRADLYSFEKLKSGASGAIVTLSAAQFADMQIDGSGGETTIVVESTDLSGANLVNWGSDDYLQAVGNLESADVFTGSSYNDIFEVSGGDAASGGAGNDVYSVVVNWQSRVQTLASDIVLTDSSGTDILDVTDLTVDPTLDIAFRGLTRAGNDLVLNMDDSLGGGNIVLVDFFTTGTITKILSELDGTDPYSYLVKGLVGTVKDEMIVGTSNNAAAETLVGGGGWDDFYGDGGNDTFIGDGKASVHYTTLSTFNAATGGLIMTEALSASGNGTATLLDGANNTWTQTYQGIGEIVGTDGNDVLYGSAIAEMDGRFSLEGGKGDDELHDGGQGTTVASYANSSNGVTVTMAWDAANNQYRGDVTGGVGAGTDVTHGITSFVGSAFNDTFNGSDADESFQGGAGNDTIYGGDGFDTIAFWGARMSVDVNLGNGYVQNDGFNSHDSVYGVEQVFGSRYNDTIVGDSMDNWLSGQEGGDWLTGGSGADKFNYDSNTHSTAANYDSISDFGDGLDTINLRGADGYTYNAAVAVGSPADLDEALTTAMSVMAANSIGFFTVNGYAYIYVKGAGSGSKSFDGTLICLEGVTEAPSYSGYGTLLATVLPSEGNNQLIGTSGNDTIDALGGNDTIFATVGTDTVDGGSGSDTLDFSVASTPVTGGIDTGTVSWSGGTTTFSGIEILVGGSGNDDLTGGTGTEVLYGGQGGDRLVGGGGNNTLYGGEGSDSLISGAGDDYMDGGSGQDVVRYNTAPNGVVVNLATSTATGEGTDTLVGIEVVYGSTHADEIYGSDQSDTLYGYQGGDTLDGGAGNDSLTGGLGADQIWGGDGNDAFVLTSASDSTMTDADLIGDFGTGTDTLTLTGAAGYTYVGEAQHPGGQIADVIAYVYATLGDNQVAYFTWEVDAYLIVKGTGTGTSYDQTLVQLPNLGLAPTYLGSGVFQAPVFGTMGDDAIIGTSGVDVIDGGDGADIITGNGGNDTILGGDGNDTLVGGDGNDVLTGGIGADMFLFSRSDTDVAALGTDTITDFSSAEGDKIALSVATFIGLGAAGQFQDGTDYFESSALESSYGGAGQVGQAGIVVVGSDSGAGGVSLWYVEDLSNTSANSYQIASIAGADTSTLSEADFTKTVTGP